MTLNMGDIELNQGVGSRIAFQSVSFESIVDTSGLVNDGSKMGQR
jgi:hypothetical protein